MRSADWDHGIDSPLPARMHTGRGSVLLVHGWVLNRRSPVAAVRLWAAGRAFDTDACSMPRTDVYRGRRRDGDEPPTAAYRTGFWGIVELPEVAARMPTEIVLEARAVSGEVLQVEVGRFDLLPGSGEAPVSAGPGAEVAICMATYNPSPALFARQVASLRAQSHESWTCVVSDDHSAPDVFDAMLEVLGDDARFRVDRSPRRQGFYWNFGRAMALAPVDARYVALCDQDDDWRADKLEKLVGALEGGATLAYSDLRIVGEDGTVRAETYWGERVNAVDDLGALLSANTVTGAAALFRRELLDDVLPLPPRAPRGYHDHWVALCALATGRLAYVDEPLSDYVQHGAQVIGHYRRSIPADGGAPPPAGFRARRRPAAWRLRWEADYFELALLRRSLALALLVRCGRRISRRRRWVLRAGALGDRGAVGLALTAARAAAELAHPRLTIGHDRAALRGALWRRLTARLARRAEPYADAAAQVNYTSGLVDLAPATRWAEQPPAEPDGAFVLEVRAAETPRVNVVASDAGEVADALADALSRAGVAARVVTPGGALPVSPDDLFAAASWPAAHVAYRAARELGRAGFLYLIEDYEPARCPPGAAALAEETYALPHAALFSTEALRDWFRGRGIGVFAGGDGAHAVFRPPIAAVAAPSVAGLEERATRRLLARGLDGAPELTEMALRGAVALGALDGWELYGAGPGLPPSGTALGSGQVLEVLTGPAADDLAGMLTRFDVGVAPTASPHPSLGAIGMAAAGLRVVTTSYGREPVPRVTGAIRTVPAEPDALARAIADAAGEAADVARRAADAAFDWPRRWADAFPPGLPELLERTR